ncbi:MAG: hypothetical protein ACE5JL_04395 [Dehalococcoidia bacterium]
MRVSPKDLYALRKAHLLAERKALVAQLAQHSLKHLTLELERKYSLLAKSAQLDVNTGIIQEDETPSNIGEEQ